MNRFIAKNPYYRIEQGMVTEYITIPMNVTMMGEERLDKTIPPEFVREFTEILQAYIPAGVSMDIHLFKYLYTEVELPNKDDCQSLLEYCHQQYRRAGQCHELPPRFEPITNPVIDTKYYMKNGRFSSQVAFVAGVVRYAEDALKAPVVTKKQTTLDDDVCGHLRQRCNGNSADQDIFFDDDDIVSPTDRNKKPLGENMIIEVIKPLARNKVKSYFISQRYIRGMVYSWYALTPRDVWHSELILQHNPQNDRVTYRLFNVESQRVVHQGVLGVLSKEACQDIDHSLSYLLESFKDKVVMRNTAKKTVSSRSDRVWGSLH
jgi:hypothetical protein